MSYTEQQISWINASERWAAGLSFTLSSLAILLYSCSGLVRRKWVNRLVLYALVENLVYTTTGFIALAGLDKGEESGLCRAQAFIIQATLPPDALWSFTLALNFTLIVFRGYLLEQIKKLEPIYVTVNCILPLVLAFILLMVTTPERGPVYGSANFWCWISPRWQFLRIVVSYAISWFCIVASLPMYILAALRWGRIRRAVQRGPDDMLTFFWTSMWFFVFALITWVPSSIYRVWGLVHPDNPAPFSLALTAAIVVQFAGSYNGIIFITRNKKECRLLLEEHVWPKLGITKHLLRSKDNVSVSPRGMIDDIEFGKIHGPI